jgi:hypothetical protein
VTNSLAAGKVFLFCMLLLEGLAGFCMLLLGNLARCRWGALDPRQG